MSIIREDKLILPGSPLGAENPQPFFRQPDLPVAFGPNFPEDKKYSYGRETGFRVLPYTMQDRYKRELVDLEFPSVVMENDFLKAEFVPALGGRLWSLFDKKRNREILYRNPVFRPANLAIRDAWFSGGIEWNIGRLGHTVHTCRPVFAGIFESAGQAILRLWEFERQTGLFWRIEFSLPEDSHELYAYTRIENPDGETKPLYWWTNTAVPQTKGVRVFSATDEVIYIVPGTKPGTTVKTMDYGRLPELPVLPGRDSSYPSMSDYSNEYFFQNDRVCTENILPWEAAVYEDGYAFGEVSTPPLVYRKMFCWGSGRGGKRWQDFLSLPGQKYLEVQAGLAPTQLHTTDIAGGGTVDWVQVFTAFEADSEKAFLKDYRAATSYVADRLANAIPSIKIKTALEDGSKRSSTEAKILSMGSGWGALELKLRKRPGPPGLSFPDESIGGAEAPWAELLSHGSLPLRPPEAGPGSFVTGMTWESLLKAGVAHDGDWLTPYHLGVMAFERGNNDEAIALWKDSLKRAENPWAYRNLAMLLLRTGDNQASWYYYRHAMGLPGSEDQSFAEEYVPILLAIGKEDEAAAVLDACIQKAGLLEALSTPLLEAAAALALSCGNDAQLDRIFSIEQPHIREGKNTMVEIWKEREIRRGNQINDSHLPPREIDFRMY